MSSLAATPQKAGEIRLADPRKRREIHSATAMVRACGWVGASLPGIARADTTAGKARRPVLAGRRTILLTRA